MNTNPSKAPPHIWRLSATIATVGLLAACSVTTDPTVSNRQNTPVIVVLPNAEPVPPIHTGDTTRTSVDWDGYYNGTIPCASCSGIDIWLRLSDQNGTTRYQLSENYIGAKNSTARSSGMAQWRKNGSVIDLKGKDEQRALFIGEGFAEFINPEQNRASGRSDYTLRKMDAFNGKDWQLLVKPNSIKTENRNGKNFVKFSGLMNFKQTMQGGHQSLTGDFIIDCTKKQYDMPKVKYFSQPFAGGQMLHQSNNNAGNWQTSQTWGVMGQAAQRYCP